MRIFAYRSEPAWFGSAFSRLPADDQSRRLQAARWFTPTTRTFNGTAPTGEVQATYSIGVVATDPSGGSAVNWFEFSVFPSLNQVAGTNSNDNISGVAGSDYLQGRGGDDVIDVSLGSNYADGGDGNDSILGGSGVDSLHGGAGDDTIYGNGGLDHIYGGSGNDSLVGSITQDVIWGDDGRDYIDGAGGADDLRGAAGADSIFGNDGNDSLFGGDGNDTLDGAANNDTINGDDGNDVIIGGAGNDALLGGTGNDRYINFGPTSGIDTITESNGGGDDTIEFSAGANYQITDLTISKNGTNLNIASGATQIQVLNEFAAGGYYRVENYTLYYNGLPYTYSYQQMEGKATGANTAPRLNAQTMDQAAPLNQAFNLGLAANTFADALSQTTLTYMATRYDGTALPTWLTFNPGTKTFTGTPGATDKGAVHVRVRAQNSAGLPGFEDFWIDAGNVTQIGTAGADIQTGTVVGDILYGRAGNDSMTGFDGDDLLSGEDGNDTLDGGLGVDILAGGTGDDLYFVDSTSDEVREIAGQGIDEVRSSVSLFIPNDVETLTLTGASAINATGDGRENWINGNFANNIIDARTGADTLVGSAGDDTYYVDNGGDVVTELANEGRDDVGTTISYVLPVNVEDLWSNGTGLALTGNALANWIDGDDGANLIDGAAGADTLVGYLGNDTFVVDNSADVVMENAGEGTDTVQATASYLLPDNVESLILLGAAAINGTGNTLANSLTGNSANNVLDGGAGSDTMAGGAGNDTYIVDSAGDSVSEVAGAGTDLVQSSLTYTLGSNVENLTLTGTSAINGTGNTLANALTGNSGANTLDGGTGADTLAGGQGNDIYTIDNAADVITENTGEGTDLANASVTYTLGGTEIENLTLTGTTAINGTGNTLNNMLTGNSGNNTLSGSAGNDTLNPGTAGTDSLIGGTGNDTYVVGRSTGITITENLNEGTDLLQAGVTATLGSNVENLTLTGATAINGTGNTLDNVLVGNSANNTLTGLAGNDSLDGGTGTDTLVGGAGNDVYTVDVSTDVTTENANEGIDTVNAGFTKTLGSNIEILFQSGSSAINGTGNALANLLRGNTAINTLSGGGGNDILEGGAGNDVLSNSAGNNLFNGGANNDTITGAAGKELFIGGTGNDTMTTGSGADLIAFNRGDGLDTVNASTTTDNVVSLGGGITYADLLFKKNANDLILVTGTNEQITFKDYYLNTSNRSVNRLQVVIEGTSDYNSGSSDPTRNKKVETFDFGQLVSAFDAARVANPSLTQWALTNSLTTYFVSGSDTAALGGDLAYQYNRFGNLGNVSFTPAQSILSAAGFGTTAQTLQAVASLQDLTPRLS